VPEQQLGVGEVVEDAEYEAHYGSYALPITVRVGATLPLLSSSIGRVCLAHMPETLTGPVLRAETGPAPLVVALALPVREATQEVPATLADELRATTGVISAELGHQAAPRRA
jgi:hypothetical protein